MKYLIPIVALLGLSLPALPNGHGSTPDAAVRDLVTLGDPCDFQEIVNQGLRIINRYCEEESDLFTTYTPFGVIQSGMEGPGGGTIYTFTAYVWCTPIGGSPILLSIWSYTCPYEG